MSVSHEQTTSVMERERYVELPSTTEGKGTTHLRQAYSTSHLLKILLRIKTHS